MYTRKATYPATEFHNQIDKQVTTRAENQRSSHHLPRFAILISPVLLDHAECFLVYSQAWLDLTVDTTVYSLWTVFMSFFYFVASRNFYCYCLLFLMMTSKRTKKSIRVNERGTLKADRHTLSFHPPSLIQKGTTTQVVIRALIVQDIYPWNLGRYISI